MSETLRKFYPQDQTPRERLAFLLDQLSDLDTSPDKKLEPVLVPARIPAKKLNLAADPVRKPDHKPKRRRSQARKPNRKSPPEPTSFHAVLSDSAKKLATDSPKTESAESPLRQWLRLTGNVLFGGIARLGSLIRARYSKPATKRLSLSQVVSMGEKRFVAIVKVEEREFLVGGSASGLSLLAQLDKTSDPAHRRDRGSGVERRSQ
jgi:hypothetical protein